MNTLSDVIVDKIAETCIKIYTNLPKTGKPVEKEWTVLSSVVQIENGTDKIDVVALGTGSKCIGASKLSAAGDILNDSHAEVMARRSFMIYLYDQIDNCLENKDSILMFAQGKFKLKDGFEFIFFSSQLPCGDASIIPKIGDEDHFGEVLKTLKRPATEDICDTMYKVSKSCDDVYRTGAKCLPGALQDPKQSGSNYHLYGQVRTKPGRGDRTLSVSCSDKMARWVHSGIQGGLLNMLLYEPIFMKHFVFGAGVPFSKESLHRALIVRDGESSVVPLVVPRFYQSSIIFPHIRKECNVRPAAGSIVWIKTGVPILEVAVLGKKLGVTKKKLNSLSSALTVSKVNIYRRFQEVINKNNDVKGQIINSENMESITYNQMKGKSVKYLERWRELKENVFKTWTVKPDIWNFFVPQPNLTSGSRALSNEALHR